MISALRVPVVIFYPRSPCGERQFHRYPPLPCYQFFYPRSPCGERPSSSTSGCRLSVFLSTLSLRRATAPLADGAQARATFLSTLSLRRATAAPVCPGLQDWFFYPRSPCGERRAGWKRNADTTFFYPRSPCGERRPAIAKIPLMQRFSIHALLAESDERRN